MSQSGDDENMLQLVKQILAHRDAKTTERIYVHARLSAAQKPLGASRGRRSTEAADGRKPSHRKRPSGASRRNGEPKK
jgi:hypothetical protein